MSVKFYFVELLNLFFEILKFFFRTEFFKLIFIIIIVYLVIRFVRCLICF